MIYFVLYRSQWWPPLTSNRCFAFFTFRVMAISQSKLPQPVLSIHWYDLWQLKSDLLQNRIYLCISCKSIKGPTDLFKGFPGNTQIDPILHTSRFYQLLQIPRFSRSSFHWSRVRLTLGANSALIAQWQSDELQIQFIFVFQSERRPPLPTFVLHFSLFHRTVQTAATSITIHWSGRHWIWGEKGGNHRGQPKCASMRTEKLSCNWRSRKNQWCLVQVTTVSKKLSHNRRRGEDYLHSMVPFILSFSPMRGI